MQIEVVKFSAILKNSLQNVYFLKKYTLRYPVKQAIGKMDTWIFKSLEVCKPKFSLISPSIFEL